MRDIVPVFCDRCALLALAQLDGAPLCADCLLAQVKRASGDVIERIVPLDLEDASYSIGYDPSEKGPFFVPGHNLASKSAA